MDCEKIPSMSRLLRVLDFGNSKFSNRSTNLIVDDSHMLANSHSVRSKPSRWLGNYSSWLCSLHILGNVLMDFPNSRPQSWNLHGVNQRKKEFHNLESSSLEIESR